MEADAGVASPWHGPGSWNQPEVPVLVKDIMVSRTLLTAKEADRLASAAQKMLWGRLRHLVPPPGLRSRMR
jgi:hypothetical protein